MNDRKQKPTPPTIGSEDVVCTCGHTVAFPLYEAKLDGFRDARRKNVTDRACKACRLEAHDKRTAEEKAAGNARRARGKLFPRLPDAAALHADYDGAAKIWSGTLTIEGVTFSGTSGGIDRLMRDLSKQYRQARKVAPNAEAPA